MLVEYLVAGCSVLGLTGLSLVAACGFAGNFTQENECLPTTKGIKDHGSDGMGQWRLDRLAKLLAFAKRIGQPWDSIRTQAWFVLYELQTDYPTLYVDLLANRKPLKTVTANICRNYERPAAAEYTEVIRGKTRLEWRIQYANDTWALFQKQKVPSPAPGPVVIGTGATAGSAGTALVLHFANCDWCIFGGGFVIGAIVIGLAAYFTWGRAQQIPRNMTTMQEYKYLQACMAPLREKIQQEADEALATLKEGT